MIRTGLIAIAIVIVAWVGGVSSCEGGPTGDTNRRPSPACTPDGAGNIGCKPLQIER